MQINQLSTALKNMRVSAIIQTGLLCGLLAVGQPATVAASSKKINFRLLYHFAQLSNEAYDGRSEIIGDNPGKDAWVATPGRTDVQYFILHNAKRKIQTIVVRGTVGSVDWALDMDTHGYFDKKTGILVHRGYDKIARTIYKNLRKHLKPGYRTYLTGHSLGGAVAGVLMTYLHHDGHKIAGLYTFGQPKFTNRGGVSAYRHLPVLRVVNQNDVVPMWPDATKRTHHKFEHLGPEVMLLSGPYYVYLNEQEASGRSVADLHKHLFQASVPDHKMKWYLKGLKEKFHGAKSVSYNSRRKYIKRHRGAAYDTESFKRKYNFNHHN